MRSFTRGIMRVDGRVIRAVHRVGYDSQTDSSKSYTATVWGDGFVSCNCRGWATHKKCWHTLDAASQSAGYLLATQRIARETRKMEPAAKQVSVSLEPVQYGGVPYNRTIRLVDLEDL